MGSTGDMGRGERKATECVLCQRLAWDLVNRGRKGTCRPLTWFSVRRGYWLTGSACCCWGLG